MDLVPFGLQMGDEFCQWFAVSCIKRSRLSTEIGELYIEIASRPQQLPKPTQLVLQRVCPFRNEQRFGGAEDRAQLSGRHSHLMQAFGFPSKPGAWIMCEQPSDMTCDDPLHMNHHLRIRCRRRLKIWRWQGKRAKELGAPVMIFGARSTEQLFKVRQCTVIPMHLFNFKFSKPPKHRSILDNRHVIECDVCDRNVVHAHADTGPPHT